MSSLDRVQADEPSLSAIDTSVGKSKLVKTKKKLKKIRSEISCIESSLLVINEIQSETLDNIGIKDNENKESLMVIEKIVEYCDEMSLILRKIKKLV